MMRIILVVVLMTGIASAQTLTAAQHVEAGQRAFEKASYAEAFKHYEAAFALESTPENAIRMVIAAGYALDLSSASKSLDVWFVKKREDAKRLGDTEESWKVVESVSKALRFAAAQKDKQIQELTQKVAELQKQIISHHVVVQTIQSNYDRQIKDLKRDYEGQLDKLRAADTQRFKIDRDPP